MRDRAALAQRLGDVRRVERRDRRGHLRHPLAEARPERAVVGLDVVGAELVGGLDEAQLLDVELVAHDVGQALDALALAPDGHDDRLLQRLAQLDLRRGARREAEAHRLARHRHRVLEADVARAGLGPVGEMDRGLRAVEVVVELVGDEGREGRDQLGDGEQRRLERGEGGAVALPEAPPRPAHVPVGEVVDELGDGPAGRRRVERVQALGDRLDRGAQTRQDPVVEVGRLALALGLVGREEGVRVPQLAQEEPDRLADRLER